MDLDQLDLNPRITAAIKKGMLCEARSGTHALWVKVAVVRAPPPLSGFSPFQSGVGQSRKGRLLHVGSWRAVAAGGELLRPHVPGRPFCRV